MKFSKFALSSLLVSGSMFLVGCGATFSGYEATNKDKLNQILDAKNIDCNFDAYNKYEESRDTSGRKVLKLDDPVYNGNTLGLKAFLCKDYPKSIEFFDSSIITSQDKSTASKVGAAVVGAIVNDNAVDYQGTYYELPTVMAYSGLDQLAEGNLQAAYSALKKATEKQGEVLNNFSSEQTKKQDELMKQIPGASIGLKKLVEKVILDNSDEFEVKQNEKMDLTKAIMVASADYRNTFIDYVAAVTYYLHGDPNEASARFYKLSQITNNPQFEEDAKITSTLKHDKKYIWVVYENGQSKPMEEFNLTLPFPTTTTFDKGIHSIEDLGTLSTINFAFSKLGKSVEAYKNINVNGKNTYMLSNMDALITNEYKATLTTRLLKAIINTAISTVANNVATAQNEALGIGMGLLTAAKNKADVRYFVGLPKDYQVVRVVNTGKLEIKADGKVLETKEINPNENYLVYVKIPTKGQIYTKYLTKDNKNK